MAFKFKVDQRVRRAAQRETITGVIRAAFLTRENQIRYVFDFDAPEGLLSICTEDQLATIAKLRVSKKMSVLEVSVCGKCEQRLSTKKISMLKTDYEALQTTSPDSVGKEIVNGEEVRCIYVMDEKCIIPCGG